LTRPLNGLHVLILEDEFLIAMDVEQLCRDNGAEDVTILRTLKDFREPADGGPAFDVAIVDLMLGGESTVDFAKRLRERGTPFIFASGYTDFNELRASFPGVVLVGKPYGGEELIAAVTRAAGGVDLGDG
jgi:DNA-binding response OmpR family regulator